MTGKIGTGLGATGVLGAMLVYLQADSKMASLQEKIRDLEVQVRIIEYRLKGNQHGSFDPGRGRQTHKNIIQWSGKK